MEVIFKCFFCAFFRLNAHLTNLGFEMPIKSTKNFALHQSNNFIWTAMREKSASRTLSGSIGNLVDPVLDLNDEQKLLQYLPHISKYQDDMFSGRSLPVPPLDRTLPKYLRTLQPILDHKQMEKAKKARNNIFVCFLSEFITQTWKSQIILICKVIEVTVRSSQMISQKYDFSLLEADFIEFSNFYLTVCQ